MARAQRSTHLSESEIQEFLPMVRYWARHYAHRAHQSLDFEDLVVVGLMGLMDAASRYNPKRDVMFKTYAEFRIRGEIIDELRRQDWMSRSERRKQKIYRHAHHQLEQDLGRNPTHLEMAKVIPLKPRDLTRMRHYEGHDILRAYHEGDVEDAQIDKVQENALNKDEVQELLCVLPHLHRKVIERRYFDDAPLADIAREIGLSEGRVSQMHGEAIILMQQAAKEDAA
jgi:RNA polymerase sigma factor for flagellar operon FliA